jgi:hypothetical protein
LLVFSDATDVLAWVNTSLLASNVSSRADTSLLASNVASGTDTSFVTSDISSSTNTSLGATDVAPWADTPLLLGEVCEVLCRSLLKITILLLFRLFDLLGCSLLFNRLDAGIDCCIAHHYICIGYVESIFVTTMKGWQAML